jgi:hypothetical protein
VRSRRWYEELQRLDATDRYAALMGRGQVTGVIAAMLAGVGAAPVHAAGGFAAVGVASLAVCLLTSLVAMQFPENRIRATQDDVESGWAATLLVGMSEARRSRRVRSAVILVAGVASVWGALDEYAPLLAASTGASDTGVAVLMVVIWAGAASGGLLAGRAGSLRPRTLAALICCGAVLLIVGALSDNPAGMIAIAAAYGIFQLATVVADTRLQHSIAGPATANPSSASGLSTLGLPPGSHGVIRNN